MFAGFNPLRGDFLQGRKHGKLDLDFVELVRANRIESRIFQSGGLRGVRDHPNQRLARINLPNAAAEPAAKMQRYEGARALPQVWFVRKNVEGFAAFSGCNQCASRYFQE
jgi:hypothetical protein